MRYLKIVESNEVRMPFSIQDIANAFRELNWSYWMAPDSERLLTQFTDHIADTYLALSLSGNTLIIEVSNVERVSKLEMGQILEILREQSVAPNGLTWARDPSTNEVWCRSTRPIQEARIDTRWLENEIDQIMLAVHAFRRTAPRVRARSEL